MMDKLEKLINNAWYHGKLPDGCSAADLRVLDWIYDGLKCGVDSTFIQESVKLVLESCGIRVKAHGTGYTTDMCLPL